MDEASKGPEGPGADKGDGRRIRDRRCNRVSNQGSHGTVVVWLVGEDEGTATNEEEGSVNVVGGRPGCEAGGRMGHPCVQVDTIAHRKDVRAEGDGSRSRVKLLVE